MAHLAIVGTANCQTGDDEYDHRYDEHGRWIDHGYSYRDYGSYNYSDYDYDDYDYDDYDYDGRNSQVDSLNEGQDALAGTDAEQQSDTSYEHYEFADSASGATVGTSGKYGYGSYNYDGYEDCRDIAESFDHTDAEIKAEYQPSDAYADDDCMYRDTESELGPEHGTYDAADDSIHYIFARSDDLSDADTDSVP